MHDYFVSLFFDLSVYSCVLMYGGVYLSLLSQLLIRWCAIHIMYIPKFMCECDFDFLMQAMFDASELITQREVVSQRVNELLQERAESFHLLLDDISIVRISQSVPQFLKAPIHGTFCVQLFPCN